MQNDRRLSFYFDPSEEDTLLGQEYPPHLIALVDEEIEQRIATLNMRNQGQKKARIPLFVAVRLWAINKLNVVEGTGDVVLRVLAFWHEDESKVQTLLDSINGDERKSIHPDDARKFGIVVPQLDINGARPKDDAIEIKLKSARGAVEVGTESTDVPNIMVTALMHRKIAVPFDLHDFPFDTQKLELELVLRKEKDLRYCLTPDANLDVPTEGITPEIGSMELKEQIAQNFELEHKIQEVRVDTKGALYRQSSVKFQLFISRNIGFYMRRFIFPYTLITIVAGLTVFIPRDTIIFRVNICVTLLLTLIAATNANAQQIPKIPYYTKLDLFQVGGIFYVVVVAAMHLTTIFLIQLFPEVDNEDWIEATDYTAQSIIAGCWFGFVVIWGALASRVKNSRKVDEKKTKEKKKAILKEKEVWKESVRFGSKIGPQQV